MRKISIDIETFSSVPIRHGVYAYAQASDSELLLFAYSVDDCDVKVVDIACGEKIPVEILKALTDNAVTKWAFNASFERVFLSYWLKRNYPEHFKGYEASGEYMDSYLDPSAWKCSMVWSAYMGLPLSLESAGSVLGLSEQKLKAGKELIRYFCVPCSPTKANGGRTRNLPSHAHEKWRLFKEYNRRDVEVELSIEQKLSRFPVPDTVWEEYCLDQVINDRGIMLDMQIVENAIRFDALSKSRLIAMLKDKTHLDNPSSVQQMRGWLANRGVDTESLDKKSVADLLSSVPADVAEVLKLRGQLTRSSVKKYQGMKASVCSDSRARGMFQFYGANRSGRWAGRIIQLQNLPQNHMSDLEVARDIVRSGDYEVMDMLYDDVPDVLSQLIRTAFIPRSGYKFIVSDFSAIEARVLAWLAGEQWRMDVFRNNGDIYCASASAMFHRPVEKHGINSHLRQKGKVAELALGYNGSVGALKAMGALKMGLAEDELKSLVNSWRASNPNIVRLWWEVDKEVRTAICEHTTTCTHGIKFICQSGMLFIELPSGRRLAYVKPRTGENRFGSESVIYDGVGTSKKWEPIESYGGKFVENIVQAISRDILCRAIRSLSDYRIVGHVHDELIIEVPMDTDVRMVCDKMASTPEWANGLPLSADGYETMFYKKD